MGLFAVKIGGLTMPHVPSQSRGTAPGADAARYYREWQLQAHARGRISKAGGTALMTDVPAFMQLDELAGAIRISRWYLNLDRERG